MQRYFFNLQDRRHFIDDVDGVELPDDAAACAYAGEVACELAKNARRPRWTLVVTDEELNMVLKLPLREADVAPERGAECQVPRPAQEPTMAAATL